MKLHIARRALSSLRELRSHKFEGLRSRTPALRSASPQLFSTPASLPMVRDNLAYRTLKTPSGKMTPPNLNYEHFFRYTSGRWLWDEDQQLRDRYKPFDVAELQGLAAKTIGADSCVSIIKLAEGGYNKVFRLIMDDGRTVLARIPNPNSGPPFHTTASEVATMEFVG